MYSIEAATTTSNLRRCALPYLVGNRIAAGFASPAADFWIKRLDLNDLIAHPLATYMVRAPDSSMQQFGIHTGDLLLVDACYPTEHGFVVAAYLDDVFMVRRLNKTHGRIKLATGCGKHEALIPHAEQLLTITGVVTCSITTFPAFRGDLPAPGQPIDLMDMLVQHPLATFIKRASGMSMVGAGIEDGDLLVVDWAISHQHGQIVVAQIGDGFTVKTFHNRGGKAKLVPANPTFPEIVLNEHHHAQRIGVVVAAIRVFAPLVLA